MDKNFKLKLEPAAGRVFKPLIPPLPLPVGIGIALCFRRDTFLFNPSRDSGNGSKTTDHDWEIGELIALMPKPVVSAPTIERELLLKALETQPV